MRIQDFPPDNPAHILWEMLGAEEFECDMDWLCEMAAIYEEEVEVPEDSAHSSD